MTDEFQGIEEKSPLIAWIHNISLNQMKYMKSKFSQYDLGHDVRYILFIYDHPNCSQEDLVKMFAQSKGNISKVLKKFEDDGFIKREINPNNRRKYMLNTTKKGSELVPKYRQISKEWEKEVGITQEDYKLIKGLSEIANNGMKLI